VDLTDDDNQELLLMKNEIKMEAKDQEQLVKNKIKLEEKEVRHAFLVKWLFINHSWIFQYIMIN